LGFTKVFFLIDETNLPQARLGYNKVSVNRIFVSMNARRVLKAGTKNTHLKCIRISSEAGNPE